MSFPSPSPAQARILWTSLTALALAVLLGLIGVLLWGFGWIIDRLSPVLLPIAIAGIIAYLLDPLVDYFERRKFSRPTSIMLVFLLALFLVAGMAASVVPRLVIETERLVQAWHSQRVQEKFIDFVEHPHLGVEFPERWKIWKSWRSGTTNAPATNPPVNATLPAQTNNPPAFAVSTNSTERTNTPAANASGRAESKRPQINSELGQTLFAWSAKTFPMIGRWLLSQFSKVASWFGLLAGLALVPVYIFYFLWEKKGISENWTDYLPIHESSWKEELVFVIRSINNYLILFFRGQVLVALCDGLLLTIGFLIIGLDFAILLGLMAGVLSIVPFLGIVLSLAPALILAAVQFADWVHPLLVVVIFILVQMAEGLVISPKIMGDRVGLHPLTIIIAVMVGTTLMGGIIGGILAIPLTAALRVLMFRYVWRKRTSPPMPS